MRFLGLKRDWLLARCNEGFAKQFLANRKGVLVFQALLCFLIETAPVCVNCCCPKCQLAAFVFPVDLVPTVPRCIPYLCRIVDVQELCYCARSYSWLAWQHSIKFVCVYFTSVFTRWNQILARQVFQLPVTFMQMHSRFHGWRNERRKNGCRKINDKAVQ